MIGKLRYLAKYLTGRDVAGRNFGVFPDDTFLVSYPKSGNTWTRFLVAGLVNPDENVTFANIEQLIPDVSSQSKRHLKRTPRPRILKSHEYFDPRYRNVIYIVRDPRDVVLSQYRFFRKCRTIDDQYPLESFVSRFIAGDLNCYGSWGENVVTWLSARRGDPRFLLLRYEDMIERTAGELNRVAQFLGTATSQERLVRAVEQSSSNRMRALEEQQHDTWVVTRGRRTDIPFVGAAKSGAWKLSLPTKCVSEIEVAWGPLMQWLGYDLVTGQEPDAGSTIMLQTILHQPRR